MKIALPMIALGLIFACLMLSLATSFVLWDWQWFWETGTGWRLALVLALGGGGAASR